MIFNPVVSKQAQEVVFSHKAIATNYATVYFNNDPAVKENYQKLLGLFLDSKLFCSDHINEKLNRPLKVSTSSGKRSFHYHGLPFCQNINYLLFYIWTMVM